MKLNCCPQLPLPPPCHGWLYEEYSRLSLPSERKKYGNVFDLNHLLTFVFRQQFLRVRYSLGVVTCIMGPTKAATIFGVKRWVAKYWRQKIMDPTFHPGPWGGFRYKKTVITGHLIIYLGH
jgi:hypothetical protein